MTKILIDQEEEKAIQTVMSAYYELEGETKQRISQHLSDKNFFMGEEQEHFDTAKRSDEVRRAIPLNAAISLKYQEYMASIFPQFQVVPFDSTASSRELADRFEKVIYDIMFENEMSSKFADASLEQSVIGTTAFTANFDKRKIESGKSGVILNNLSPARIRVGFSSNDWREVEYFITTKRFSLPTIKRIYGIDIDADSYDDSLYTGNLSGWIGATGSDKTFPGPEAVFDSSKTQIPMATVFTYWDYEKHIILVGGKKVYLNENHDFGFTPCYIIRNFTLPNEPWGKPDHYWIRDAIRSLNYLTSKAEGIIKYQSGPIILDYGNTLKGRILPAGNNVVVPLSSKEQGMGLEYLEWRGQFYPLLQQMEVVKKLIHDISGMPEAAFGSYQPGIKSGFQLQVQLQPTLLRIQRKKLEWEIAFQKMVKQALTLVKKFDKKAASEMPDGVENLQIKLVWPETLPQDITREVQNVALLKKINLISDYSALEKLGVQDPTDEMDIIKTEQQERGGQTPPPAVTVSVKADAATVQGQELLSDVGLPLKTPPPAELPQGIAQGNPQAQSPQALTNEMMQNMPGPETPPAENQRPYPTTPQEQAAQLRKLAGGGG